MDFSDCSEHALQYALAFAQAHGAALELIHVVQPIYAPGTDGLIVDVMSKMTETGTARLKETAERLRQKHSPVSQHLVTGVPFVEIVKRAREQDVDLIVMGTHGRSGVSHMLIGSCAERVVRKAPCPVLTVRHPAHDFVMP